jgi:hypothetical protein
MCSGYTNHIKTFSDRNMHMYADVSIVGRQAYAPTSFLMLHDILKGLIYYQ